MSAYIYGLLVDMFGDVPYSEALQGQLADGGITSPSYDDAATIYATLITLLDEAIAQITNPATGSLEIGAEDIFFAGDTDAWIKVANSLKLKLLMRQTVTDAASVEAQVIDVINTGNFIESSADNFQMVWTGSGGSQNPFYSYLESRLGNFYVLSNTSKEFLENGVPGGDPRMDLLYDVAPATSSHVGIDQGDITLAGGQVTDYSTPSGTIYAVDIPTIFMSATEVWFYRAEAAERFSLGGAATLVAAGVESSFDYLGAGDASNYIINLDYAGAADPYQIIAEQMWVAFNALQPAEGWITTRKFDNATNEYFATQPGGIFDSPTENTLGVDVFPSIWRYPQSEIDANANLTGDMQHDLTDKVFWDN